MPHVLFFDHLGTDLYEGMSTDGLKEIRRRLREARFRSVTMVEIRPAGNRKKALKEEKARIVMFHLVHNIQHARKGYGRRVEPV